MIDQTVLDLHQSGHLARLKFAVDELLIEIDLKSTRRQQSVLDVVADKENADRIHPLALLKSLDKVWSIDA